MNEFRKMIRNYKYWACISILSLAVNGGLAALAVHYYKEAKSEINYVTIYWHKSNTAFCPVVSVPGVCYEKEIVVDGKEQE